MNLHPDWKAILQKAWSVRLMVLAALLSGVEVILPILQPMIETKIPTGAFAGVSGIITGAALISRIVAQKGLNDGA